MSRALARYLPKKKKKIKLGPKHVDVAASYNYLGLVHNQLGDLRQAKDFHKRGLDIYTKRLGSEHL